MELLIVVVAILFIGFPIWVLIRIGSMSGLIQELRGRIGNLEHQLGTLRREMESRQNLESRSARSAEQPRSEQAVDTLVPPVAPVAPPIIPPQEPTPHEMPVEIFAQETATPPLVEAPPPLSPPPLPKAAPSFPKVPSINWEQLMGVKLFAWIGGLSFFIGVVFALKYSFEHNLISPELRVAIGFLIGLGLVVGGVLLSRKEYAVTSQTLCATGVVILYAVTFACRSIYHFPFFGQIPTFLFMILITGAAFVLAVRLNAIVVAVLGMLGGFLTPILLSTGQDNPFGLFAYIALLDIGLVAVALHRRWNFLTLLAAIGTILMQLGWVAKFFEVPKVFTGITIFLSFSALFVGAFFIAQKRKQNDHWFSIPAVALPFVALAFGFFLLGYRELGQQPGIIFTFVFVADLCLLALAFFDSKLRRVDIFAGLTLFVMLSVWTAGYLTNSLLNWGLGFFLVFAILHSVFPIALQHLRPGTKPAWWAHLFSPIALVLVMVPIFKIPEISFLVWPCILLLDVLAVGVAVLTASLVSIVAVLVLTLGAAAIWIFRIPADVTQLPESLLLIGGFAAFFLIATLFATRKIAAIWARTGGPKDSASGLNLTPDNLSQLPAMAAILPFVLLIMVAVRLPLPNPSAVFGLAMLLLVLLLGVARKFTMEWLPAVGLGCVLALELAWHVKQFHPEYAGLCLGWYIGFYLIFAAFPFVFRKYFASRTIPWAVAALSAPVCFYLVYGLVTEAFPNRFMGLLPALFAIPSLGSLAVMRTTPKENPARINQLAWFGGVALFFVTLIFPIQFERQWITIGWALEGAALLWLFHRIPHGGLRLTGVALLFIAFLRLAVNPAVLDYHARSATPIWNWYLYAYTVVTVSLFAGAKLLAPPRNMVLGKNAPAILSSLGTVLAFLLLNIEIADYFSDVNQTLTFQFSGNLARDMTYTIAWALFALILLVIGIAKHSVAGRYAGLGLLAVTLLKLFVHDLAHLSQLYRIAALISVAVIAMIASVIYQKFFSVKRTRQINRTDDGRSSVFL